MICPRCKIEMHHIDFPKQKHTHLGSNGRPLPDAVERCPRCLTDIPSRRRVAPIPAPKPVQPQPEQLMLFSPTVGGLQ